jgi:hypothetical protein
MNAPFRTALAVSLFVSAVFLAATRSSACSVPVYRYALERWPSDFYRIVIFHKGPLTKQHQSLVNDLGPDGIAAEKNANLRVQTVDLAGKPDDDMLKLWKSQQAAKPQLPWMVVRYPNVANYAPAWSGPLSKSAVDTLIDSPLRRELAKRLLAGETSVWILLESGNKKADEAAFAVLKEQLAVAEKTLKLPEIDTKDLLGDGAAAEVAKLRIRFSIIRLSRDDPKEKLVVEMLLGSEGSGDDSLRAREFVKQTMAFPIFGRGRIRYGLVGKGIAKDTIQEACAYLTGPCKCQIKQGVENRGMDLVTAVDWNRMVMSTIKDKPDPPLLGLGGLDANVPTLRTGPPPARDPVAAAKPKAQPTTQSVLAAPDAQQRPDDVAQADSSVETAAAPAPSTPTADSGQSHLLRNVGILFGVLLLVIFGGSFFLRTKSA